MQQPMASYSQQQAILPPGGFGMPLQATAVQNYPQHPPVLQGATRSKHWTGNMTRTIAHYQRIEQIGEGAYGQVYKALCKDTGRYVALKKLIIQHGGYNGMTPSVVREIKILQRLRHPRLVEMIEVVSSKGVEHLDEHDEHRGDHKKKDSKDNSSKSDSRIIDAREGYKGNLFLVLEYVSHDLMALLDVRYQFSELQVKCIFKQLLEALDYMHEQKYVHRDLKPANILIDSQHRVKLADFGLARCIEPPILDKLHDRGSSLELTNKVVTVMYRPIEILLGATRYGYSIDMWSAGCILAELVLGKTLLAGKLEMEQLNLIFDLLGTPTPNDGLQDLPLLRTGKVKIDKPKTSRLRDKYMKKMSLPCLNLLEKLLELDPAKRLTAGRALESRYFKAEPRAPDHPEQLGPLQLGNGDCDVHEFQTKKKRKEVKAIAGAARDEAKESGATDEAAETIFREVYDEQMLRVQEEGSSALKTKEEKEKEEEKLRREEEKRRLEDEKQREVEERSKSRRQRGVDEDRRGDKDKKRHLGGDDRRDRGRDEEDRKRRKREDEDGGKSDRRSDRDHRRREDGRKEDRGRLDDERGSERRSSERRSERKRSSDSRRGDERGRDDRRREKERRRSSGEIVKLDEGANTEENTRGDYFKVRGEKDSRGGQKAEPSNVDEGEKKRKEDDTRSREPRRNRERGERSRDHKKSSRRDRNHGRHRGRDGDRERDHHDRDRDRDRNEDGRHDDYKREGDRGGPPGRDFKEGPPRDDQYGRGPDHYGPGDSHGPPPPDQRSSRGAPPDQRNNQGPPSDRRGPPPSDRRNDRGAPPPDRNSRGPPALDHRSDRGPLPPDRNSRGPPSLDHRNDRGPPPSDRNSRGPPPSDHRNDRGGPPNDRNGRGPPNDHRSDRGGPPNDRRGPPDMSRERGPPADSQYGPGNRGPPPSGYRGGPPHRDERPPSREERRFSPPRGRRRN